MKLPTLENIQKENVEYSQYLVAGGAPISIHLELAPKSTSWDWTIETRIPEQINHLILAVMFTHYIREAIIKAIQPPSEQTKPTIETNN